MIFFFLLVGWLVFCFDFFFIPPLHLNFFFLDLSPTKCNASSKDCPIMFGVGFWLVLDFFFFLSSPFWWFFFFFWQGGGLVFCFCFLLGWEKVCRSLLSLRCGGLEQVILMTSFLQNYSFSKQNVNPMGGKRQSNILSFDSYIIVFFITYRVLYSPSTFECYFSTSHSSS